MLQDVIARISDALAKVSPEASRELAQAIGQSTSRLEHFGTMSIIGSLPYRSRSFSSLDPDLLLRPTPPVADPVIDRGVLETGNHNDGLADRAGENGYAIYNTSGIVRNDGESWVIKWGKVSSTSTIADGRPAEISTSLTCGSITKTYYAANCVEVSDAKGRSATEVPVRVFQRRADLPSTGETIPYLRDLHGLAWRYDDGPRTEAQYAKASAGWAWVTGQTDKVGYVEARVCDDLFGSGVTGTAFKVYLPATRGGDPNVQTSDVVAYMYSASMPRSSTTVTTNVQRVCVSGYLDDKIGTVKIWSGTVASVPKGWTVHSDLSGKFPVGYSTTETDYTVTSATGGSHPIQPHAHRTSDNGGTWGTSSWTEANWTMNVGVTVYQSVTSDSGSKVVSITIPEHNSATESLAITTSLSIGNEYAGVSVQSTSLSGASAASTSHNHSASAASESSHTHSLTESSHPEGEGTNFSHVYGGFTGAGSSHGHDITVDEGGSHTHTISGTAHSHDVSDSGHGHGGSITVSITDHSHTIAASTSSSEAHTHSILHSHTSHTNITGGMTHRQEDFRPPYRVTIFIRRVGPDGD